MSGSPFFIAKNETAADYLLDSDQLMRANPDYYGPRFEAIKELRDLDDGTLHRGNEFRRVASLVNVPLHKLAGVLDPGWMKDRKKFYAWLDRGENRRYCTYDRRKGGAKRGDMVTFINGKEV